MEIDHILQNICKSRTIKDVHLGCIYVVEKFKPKKEHRKNLFKTTLERLITLHGINSWELMIKDCIEHGNIFLLQRLHRACQVRDKYFYGLTSFAIKMNQPEILEYLYKHNHYACPECDLLFAAELKREKLIPFIREHRELRKCHDCELLDVVKREDQVDFLKIWNISMLNVCPMNDVIVHHSS